MTHTDPYYTEEQTLLRRVTHIIATTPNALDCVPQVLEVAQLMAKASGAALILFDEPELISVNDIDAETLPDAAIFQGLAEELGEGIWVNPDLPAGMRVTHTGWLAAVIRTPQKIVGLLWLVFDDLPDFSESTQIALITLLDAVTIVVSQVRSTARQEKLARNQSEFMRIVSHDLRSPLTAMHGFASMLEMVGELNEKQEYFIEKIMSGIAQMTSLVDNFQDAGRYDPETGFYEMERAPCDINAMVQRILHNHLLPAEKQELTLKANISDEVPIINADSNMLERAITNLVDNAIKYTPNGRSVEVSVYIEDDDLVVSVADDGLGISPENQKMLFERHVRIPRREHKKVKGSGLGLFIVRSVAQRHGGDAWVKSAEGTGTTFYISVPLKGANMLVPDSSIS